MIGLGRMGGNMAERLRRAGHTIVGFDQSPDSKRDVDSLEDLVAQARQAARGLGDGAGRQADHDTIAALGELLEPGDVVIDGGNSRYTDDQMHAAGAGREEDRLHRLRRVRRRVGPDRGLRADGRRRRTRTIAKLQPIFDALKPEGELRLRPRRQGRRRALREDGPQRHRVRNHAGLRRGLGAARGDRPRHRRPGDLRVLAEGHRHPVLAARPRGPGARRGRPPDQAQGLRPGLRRGPLDGARRRSTTPCRCR